MNLDSQSRNRRKWLARLSIGLSNMTVRFRDKINDFDPPRGSESNSYFPFMSAQDITI